MVNNVVFSVSTQLEMEGRQLKAVKPDKDGIYRGIPLTVIGCDSRNKVFYEKESVMKCLTDMESRFAMNLSTGDLEGEWGHPLLFNDDKTLTRLVYIDRARVSHFFTRCYAKDMGDGTIIVYGDVKPFGPYGAYLKESFEDPTRNTSFSLRSAAVQTGNRNGVVQKKMLCLVTFDAVDGPGFLKASKRFQDPAVAAAEGLHISTIEQAPKCKSYDVELAPTKRQFLATQEQLKLVGQENIVFTNQAVLDAFGCDRVTVRNRVLNMDQHGRYVDVRTGKPVSMFRTCFSK